MRFFGGTETVNIINVTVSGGDAVFNVEASHILFDFIYVPEGGLHIEVTGETVEAEIGTIETMLVPEEEDGCSEGGGESVTISGSNELTIVSSPDTCITQGVITMPDGFVFPSLADSSAVKVEDGSLEADEENEGAINLYHLLALLLFLPVYISSRKCKNRKAQKLSF